MEVSMKQIVLLIISISFLLIVPQISLAEHMIGDYCVSNQCLQFEWVGSKFNTWGLHDVEAVQWDRLVFGTDGRPEIYLEISDMGIKVKLNAVKTPYGDLMIIYGTACGVPCGSKYQIHALVWENNQKVTKYWAVGPGEPIPATLRLKNVVTKEQQNGYDFVTTCCCQ